jgi:hypothetical protein
MRLATESHPVMLAEPSFNSRAAREKMVELLFEKYKAPGRPGSVAAGQQAGARAEPVESPGTASHWLRCIQSYKHTLENTLRPRLVRSWLEPTRPSLLPPLRLLSSCSRLHGQERGAELLCQRAADEPGGGCRARAYRG